MAKKTTHNRNRKTRIKSEQFTLFAMQKKTLFKVGHHLIDVDDVASIACVRRNLHIIKMKSNPNPEYPLWANTAEITPLLKKFNIENADGTDKYKRGEDEPAGAFDPNDSGMNPDEGDGPDW